MSQKTSIADCRNAVLLRSSFAARAQVMKAHQVNVPASSVVRHLEEIDNSKETRLARQFGSNVRKTDRLDGVDLDLAFPCIPFFPWPTSSPCARPAISSLPRPLPAR